MTEDTQTELREQVDHYLDTYLIKRINIEVGLQDVTAAGDKYRSHLHTGKLIVTITLAS